MSARRDDRAAGVGACDLTHSPHWHYKPRMSTISHSASRRRRPTKAAEAFDRV
jgi:hypothetical protein